jgi:hypothetical protein
VVLKVSYEGEMRRMNCESSTSTLCGLTQTVFELFAPLRVTAFSVRYIDDEGDQVDMGSDEELQEAFRQAAGAKGVLRLQLVVAPPAPPEPLLLPAPAPVSASGPR